MFGSADLSIVSTDNDNSNNDYVELGASSEIRQLMKIAKRAPTSIGLCGSRNSRRTVVVIYYFLGCDVIVTGGAWV